MYYTKYRPQKFSEISRPNEAADALVKQILTDKTVHAYLFVGSRGTGKTTTARVLAKALNCQSLEKNGDPCNTCENCLGINSSSYPDLIEIDAASNRGIDDIRQLKEKINLSSVKGKYKTYIIDEVHMLTTEAFNALLKTLEEPPRNTVFILCTTELHKVPETIKSRCQIYKFKRATKDQLIKKLSAITKSEKAKIDESILKKIAAASAGGFRDAENLLQQYLEGEVNLDLVVSKSDPSELADFISAIIKKDLNFCLAVLNSIEEDGNDFNIWVNDVVIFLRDLLLSKEGASNLADISEDAFKKIEELRTTISSIEIINIINALLRAQRDIKTTIIPQLPIEIALIELVKGYSTFNDVSITPTPKNPTAPKIKSDNLEIKVETTQKIENNLKKEKVSESLTTTTEVTIENPQPDSAEIIVKYDKSTLSISVDEIHQKWPAVISELNVVNGSITALLKNANPIRIEEHYIVLEVFFAFHKERLEHSKNRKVVEETLSNVLGTAMSIKCELNPNKPKKYEKNESGVLTDLNIVSISTDDPNSIVNVFDGNLPLGMMPSSN